MTNRDEYNAGGAEVCQQWTNALRAGLAVTLNALRPSMQAYGEIIQRMRDADQQRNTPGQGAA